MHLYDFFLPFCQEDDFRNFIFASREDLVFLKEGLLFKEEFPPPGANSFYHELTLIQKGDKMKSCLP